jgi:dynein intermediate chain 1
MMHHESVEAKEQAQYESQRAEAAKDAAKDAAQAAADSGHDDVVAGGDDGGKNQFNYSERAAQTFDNPYRNRGVATMPPPVSGFSATVSQWEIYDSYMSDYLAGVAAVEQAKTLEKKKSAMAHGTGQDAAYDPEPAVAPAQKTSDDAVHTRAMGRCLQILERMISQNAEDEIFQDFKYWEDASDSFRPGEGSLLPLWRFSTDRSKRKQVTALEWNPKYTDLFAVGYGSYDFLRQGAGMICCFSLKNTSHPEYVFYPESGVMCLAFHPQHPSLLAVGCYDGTVCVYDVRKQTNKPLYTSSIKSGKHTDPVWQVSWQEEDVAKELNFYSISSDGRVASWLMSKNELKMEPVMVLKLVASVVKKSSNGTSSGGEIEADEGSALSGLAGGCCFDFNKVHDHLFIVGTEEGKIHKCSKAYSGQYLETYIGHHMAIHALKWNPFHSRVFLSCSADWTVKLWDRDVNVPVMSFDLGNAVGDVAWSPYSSTVFSAVTADGKVHTYDLAENKHEPLCEQKVVKRAKLTHVQFNNESPMLIVGDDRGGVISLKLSPNLRKVHEPRDEEGNVIEHDPIQLQIDKMDKLLSSADTKPSKN